MRLLCSVFLFGSLLGLGCSSNDNSSEPSPTPRPAVSTSEESTPVVEELHVRALFYYERTGSGGVVAYPTSTEHAPRSEGEKAWLEVHTSGASYAYAFAVFPDGEVETLWLETIGKKQHTPPMNAFENGLSLTQKFKDDTTVLVVASQSPLEGVDELTDCSETPSDSCSRVIQTLEQHTPEEAPASALRMRHMEVETPAYGSMNTGNGVAAVAFAVKGR